MLSLLLLESEVLCMLSNVLYRKPRKIPLLVLSVSTIRRHCHIERGHELV
jgi:hypothetical protein